MGTREQLLTPRVTGIPSHTELPVKTHPKPTNPRHQRGLTLLEIMAALAVLAVALGAALPNAKQALDRRHLEGASAQLATDLRHARGLAVTLRTSLHFAVVATASDSCYVLHTGSAGDCTCRSDGSAQCQSTAEAVRVVGFDASQPVRLASRSTSMAFDPDRGTVTPTGTLRLQLNNGPALHQIVNVSGRVRACSPGGAMTGYPAC